MSRTATLPLTSLIPGTEVNSRKHDRTGGVAALAASIKAIGLLNPLVVRPAPGKEGIYEIIDGNTRFLALQKNAGKKGGEAPVTIVETDDTASLEASLAANVVRSTLHPVDEYEAYSRLCEQGLSTKEIADRFMQPEKWVRQRLQLADLAPELRAAWREGKITTEQAAAFSCSPDQDRQRQVWKAIAKSREEWLKRPDSIRREMLEAVVRSNDKRVVVVGIDAYRDAGGTFTEDLFEDAQNIADVDLLNQLYEVKLDSICTDLVKVEGWAWAKLDTELDTGRWDYMRLSPKQWMSPEEWKAFESAKYNWQRDDLGKPAWALAAQDPDARAKTGVIVSVSHNGEIRFDRLLVPPAPVTADEDDHEGGEDSAKAASSAPAQGQAEEAKLRVSQPLHEYLAERVTVAMSKAIAGDPHAALCAIIATIKTKIETYSDAPIRISTSPWSGHALPSRISEKTWADQFKALTPLSTLEVLDEAARLAAYLVDFTDKKFDSDRGHNWKRSRVSFLHDLAGQMTPISVRAAIDEVFDPSAYFSGCSGALIDEAMQEMGAGKAKGKKDEKVATAAEAARASGWLPPELRTPHYLGPKGNGNG